MNFIGLESCMECFHKHLLCDGSNADIIALKLHDLSSGVILVSKFLTGININTDPKFRFQYITYHLLNLMKQPTAAPKFRRRKKKEKKKMKK